MDIGAVIVTYNRLPKLKKALQCYSNQTHIPKYIIVVNNGSTDDTDLHLNEWKAVQEPFDKYVITSPTNEGGAGGFYHGMEAACKLTIEWLWLSDDDAYPRSDAFEKISNYYDKLTFSEQSSIAAICSAVYNNGSIHYGHRNHATTTVTKVKIKASEPREYEQEEFEFNMLSYVGSCVRKSVLEEVGLDEKDYFIYRDDQEHSLRMNKVGKFVCVTNSIVDHDTPPFDENEINWGKFYFKRNDLLMIRKNFPFRHFALRFLRRYIFDASIFSRKDPKLKKMYRAAYKDALLNRKGVHTVYRLGWKSNKGGVIVRLLVIKRTCHFVFPEGDAA